MTDERRESDDEIRAHYEDLETLRRVAAQRQALPRDTPEWEELVLREETLTRRIRDWAGRSDEES